MGEYADHVHVTALARALNVNVTIAYLDLGSTSDKPNVITFPEENAPACVHLLFRPDHYDIIYSNKKETCNIIENLSITPVEPGSMEAL